jgi:hypothetical protein
MQCCAARAPPPPSVLTKRRFSFHRQQQSISPIATQHSHAAVDAPQVSHNLAHSFLFKLIADLYYVCVQSKKVTPAAINIQLILFKYFMNIFFCNLKFLEYFSL